MDNIELTSLCAAQAENELLRDKLGQAESEMARLRAALDQMNAISKHQTNHVFMAAPDHPMAAWYGGRIPVHPLTCGTNSGHTLLFPFWDGARVILRCRDCDYEQTYLPV